MPGPGDTLLHYRLESLIGQGGAGQVFCAYDTRLRRRVALKILRADKLPGPGVDPNVANAASRMMREARAVAALHHPNVVSIYDVGEIDGAPYIVMELAAGRTLRAYVTDGATPIERKIRWLRDVADGLAAAHAISIIHRDVKPENVIVREDGKVQVLDFGIAKRLEADESAELEGAPISASTRLGYVLGTPRYMSPEQVKGDVLDTRTDQFSWGVMAYELLAGIHPWSVIASGATRPAMPVIVTTYDARPLKQLAPAVPDEVVNAIARAMSKGVEQRFASMTDVVRALERFAEPLSAQGAGRGAAAPPQAKAGGLVPALATTVDDDDQAATATAIATATAAARTVAQAPLPHAIQPIPPTPPIRSHASRASHPSAPRAHPHPGSRGSFPAPVLGSARAPARVAVPVPVPAKSGCGGALVAIALFATVCVVAVSTCGYILYEDVKEPVRAR